MHTPRTIILVSAILVLSGCHSDHVAKISSKTSAPSVSNKVIPEEAEPLETIQPAETIIQHRLEIPYYVQETGYFYQ